MHFDDVAWEQSEHISDTWCHQFLDDEVKKPIGRFILRYGSGKDSEFTILKKGAFNIVLHMKYTYSATNIRFTQPGPTLFPEEKVKNEVAVIRYIWDETLIPIPFVVLSGTRDGIPLNISPFIMMSHIEHTVGMYDALNTPGCPIEEQGVLDPNINKFSIALRLTRFTGRKSTGGFLGLRRPAITARRGKNGWTSWMKPRGLRWNTS